MTPIAVLWDESHLWGLLVWRALSLWGLPFSLVTAREVAAGALAGKSGSDAARLLVVPGGTARRKAACLGRKGLAGVRAFVENGGTYLGFCGGAGLGLSGRDGLNLCPWTRQGFDDRLQHFLSGHISVDLARGHDLTPPSLGGRALVPVWWPGRFDDQPDPQVSVLAAYGEPGPDFWVADLPLSRLPEDTLADWAALYGLTLGPGFLRGHACAAECRHGRGRAILSYAHLETPASPQANVWLSHLLDAALDRPAENRPALPAWDLAGLPVAWEDPVLLAAREALAEIIAMGRDHLLFFWRTPWLLGWRRGLPGAAVNTLFALAAQCLALPPSPEALAYWKQARGSVAQALETFRQGLAGYLLAERLSMTVIPTAPDTVFPQALKEQREALFGPPMSAGGLYALLLDPLDELARLQLPGDPACTRHSALVHGQNSRPVL